MSNNDVSSMGKTQNPHGSAKADNLQDPEANGKLNLQKQDKNHSFYGVWYLHVVLLCIKCSNAEQFVIKNKSFYKFTHLPLWT